MSVEQQNNSPGQSQPVVQSMRSQLQQWSQSDVMRDNWDSYGAKAISERVLRVACEIADRLEGLVIDGRMISRVDPTNCGGVCFSDGDESVWIKVEAFNDDELREEGLVV